MAKFCTNCGKVIAENDAFCAECGTKCSAEPAPQPITAEAPTQAPQQAYVPPQQSYAPPAAADPATKVVGTGTFFGLTLLFAIPVIGWIACLIMAFAPKNKNIKNYARAMLIWIVIGIAISVALFFLLRWVGDVLTDYINQLTGETFGELGDIFEQIGKLGDVAGQLGELGDVVGDLGELGDVAGDLGELGDVAGDLGELGDIMDQLPEGSYSSMPVG